MDPVNENKQRRPAPVTAEVLALEAVATGAYISHVGKTLLASLIDGFIAGKPAYVELRLPVPVQVVATDPEGYLNWGNHQWIDPHWDVIVLDDREELAGLERPWVYGTSYCLDGSIQPTKEWVLAEGVITAPKPAPSQGGPTP